MRMTGIEPARLLTIEPKSIASASSATSASDIYIITNRFKLSSSSIQSLYLYAFPIYDFLHISYMHFLQYVPIRRDSSAVF